MSINGVYDEYMGEMCLLNMFCVAIIPHTLENTNLKDLRIGDFVNIETDILGRYVEKFLSPQNNITEDFLKENGFM